MLGSYNILLKLFLSAISWGGGEVQLFGGEASPAPPSLDETLPMTDCYNPHWSKPSLICSTGLKLLQLSIMSGGQNLQVVAKMATVDQCGQNPVW